MSATIAIHPTHINLLPEWLDNMTPFVELVWSSPATRPSNTGTTWMNAPGVIWPNQCDQFALEALVPANGRAGWRIGAVAQFRMAFGVISPTEPTTLGKE